MHANKDSDVLTPKQVIKDQYVLEFLGINKYEKLYENDLEEKLLTHLQEFLLELRRGFSLCRSSKTILHLQMYVNYYTRKLMNEDDNLPIGIVLCADKSDAVVKYTLPDDNKQIFASKYMLYIPTKDEFKEELLKERDCIESYK